MPDADHKRPPPPVAPRKAKRSKLNLSKAFRGHAACGSDCLGHEDAASAESSNQTQDDDAMDSILGHLHAANSLQNPFNASESSSSLADDESDSEGDDGVEEQYFAERLTNISHAMHWNDVN